MLHVSIPIHVMQLWKYLLACFVSTVSVGWSSWFPCSNLLGEFLEHWVDYVIVIDFLEHWVDSAIVLHLSTLVIKGSLQLGIWNDLAKLVLQELRHSFCQRKKKEIPHSFFQLWFKQSHDDYILFNYKIHNGIFIAISAYVDDIIIISTDNSILPILQIQVNDFFKIKKIWGRSIGELCVQRRSTCMSCSTLCFCVIYVHIIRSTSISTVFSPSKAISFHVRNKINWDI